MQFVPVCGLTLLSLLLWLLHLLTLLRPLHHLHSRLRPHPSDLVLTQDES